MEEARACVVDVAHSFLGTPYHSMGRIKGPQGGVDCLTLLAEVYAEAGIIPSVAVPYYPHDWHLNRSQERYLEGLLPYAAEVSAPLPGDIVLWKFGHCFSHGAIIIRWPLVIHAYVGHTCLIENAHAARWLSHIGAKPRPLKFFSPWA